MTQKFLAVFEKLTMMFSFVPSLTIPISTVSFSCSPMASELILTTALDLYFDASNSLDGLGHAEVDRTFD